MPTPSRIHLLDPFHPDDPEKAKVVYGYVERYTELGVTIGNRDDGRGDISFYPAHLVYKIDYNTGWS